MLLVQDHKIALGQVLDELGPGQLGSIFQEPIGLPQVLGKLGPRAEQSGVQHFLGSDSWATNNRALGPNCPDPAARGPIYLELKIAPGHTFLKIYHIPWSSDAP